MQPIHFLPPDSLKPYISFYGIMEAAAGFSESYVSPPLGLCGIILTLEGKSQARVNDNLFMPHRYAVNGQVTHPVVGNITGKLKSVLVFIQPCGLYQLFGTDMSRLTNTSIPLSELLGQEAADVLISKLETAAGNENLIATMNELFSAQTPREIAPKVKLALDYIHLQKGNVTVKDIERNCFIAPRILERYFKLYIGLSPRDYARIFQFKCLYNYIKGNPGVNRASLLYYLPYGGTHQQCNTGGGSTGGY